MRTLKHLLAFPMFGAAAWLTWVLSQQAGQGGLAVILAASVALAFAGWVYGIAQRRRMSGQGFRGLYGVAGVPLVAIVAGVAMLGGNSPPPHSNAATITQVKTRSALPVVWSPERVSALRGEGKPILLNFTASWCITCQVNDKVALSTLAVKEALVKTGATYMVADSTNYDPAIEKALAGFGRAGLPLYVVYPAHGRAPVILPQILTPTIVIDALEKARQKPA
jgi:thiol:disulfide interchange protein DsbD